MVLKKKILKIKLEKVQRNQVLMVNPLELKFIIFVVSIKPNSWINFSTHVANLNPAKIRISCSTSDYEWMNIAYWCNSQK